MKHFAVEICVLVVAYSILDRLYQNGYLLGTKDSYGYVAVVFCILGGILKNEILE